MKDLLKKYRNYFGGARVRHKHANQVMMALAMILSLPACTDPFEAPGVAAGTPLLVVEGFLNAGTGATNVRISYSRPFSEETQSEFVPIGHAAVSVEDEQGNSFTLQPVFGGGEYMAEDLPLISGRKYRLRITAGEGKEYLSDFVEVKPTPEIDSIGWELKDGGLQIYVNTHDPTNNTRYYRWEYDETWEFHTPYVSLYKYSEERNEMDVRSPEEMVNICWDSGFSTSIITGSTTRLSEDVVYKQPLLFAPWGSQKMSVLYSIRVRQYAMTKEAFEYWETMKKNTEEIGSIFDPLPSNLRGNIHNVADPSEQVIGYISAGSVREKRIYIDNDELPRDWNDPRFCEIIDVRMDSLQYFFTDQVYLAISEWYEGLSLAGYKGTQRSCADCTLSGVTQKPDFWPR